MVFLAADPQLGRAVALKVPRPEALLTGELRERFVREARAAAGLDHPNLVPVYEAGAVGPLCYIASAYCPGVTLAEWIKERSELVPERLAAGLVATLADAVGHAHARGVVHRDLKPGNVLLQGRQRDSTHTDSTVQDPSSCRDSAAAVVDFVPRITDFGLAKLTADAPAPTEESRGAETRTGAVLGTPNYMAPEQASGKNKEVGPAADIYALGAILYELLTGRPPFRGESLLDTLEQVRSRDPLPPGRLRPKLARDLETICLKCLQKEPHKRYDSAAALAADLRRYLAGEPIQARPIRAWERGLKWARRRPALAALLAVSILSPSTLATVVLAYDAQLRQRNKYLKEALQAKEEQRQEANKNLRFAGLAIENFATKLGQDKRLLAHNLEDLRKDYLQSAMNLWRQLLKQRPDDPERQEEYALTLQRFGTFIREMGTKPEAIEILQGAVDIFKKLQEEHPNDPHYQFQVAKGLNNLGAIYGDVRQSELAESTFGEAREILRQLVVEHPAVPEYLDRLAGSLSNLGVLYEQTGRSQLAESAYAEARDHWEKLIQAGPRVEEYQSNLAKIHFNLGMMYQLTSRLKLAEESFGKAHDLRRGLTHDHPTLPAYQDDLADSLIHLGLVYVQTGRAKQAVEVYREAGNIYRKLADDHPKLPNYRDFLARVYHNLGLAYERLRRPELAEDAYSKSCELREQLARKYPTIPDYQFALSGTYNNLAFLFRDTGRTKEAIVPLGKARENLEKLVHDYPAVIRFRVRLANTYSSLGQIESLKGGHWAALEWFDQSVRMLEAVLKQEPRQTEARRFLDNAYERRAVTLAQMGRHVSAMDSVNELASRSSLSAVNLYNLACICSLCSAAVRRDIQLNKAEQHQKADQYATRAIDFLKQAKAAGFFKLATAMEEMRKDKDLDALRQRRDFQELMLSLEAKKPPMGNP